MAHETSGIVVVDASVLIHISSIDQFKLLSMYYPELYVPERVYREVVIDGWGLPGSEETKQQQENENIHIQNVERYQMVHGIAEKYGVSTANAEVIQLAVEKNAELVLADEEEIRAAARDRNIDVTGCLGILVKNVKVNRLNSSEAVRSIDKLINSGYRIDREITRSLKEELQKWDQ